MAVGRGRNAKVIDAPLAKTAAGFHPVASGTAFAIGRFRGIARRAS